MDFAKYLNFSIETTEKDAITGKETTESTLLYNLPIRTGRYGRPTWHIDPMLLKVRPAPFIPFRELAKRRRLDEDEEDVETLETKIN